MLGWRIGMIARVGATVVLSPPGWQYNCHPNGIPNGIANGVILRWRTVMLKHNLPLPPARNKLGLRKRFLTGGQEGLTMLPLMGMMAVGAISSPVAGTPAGTFLRPGASYVVSLL